MNRAAFAGGILILVGVLAVPSPAAAASTTEVIEGQYLRLVSVADWEQTAEMTPGEKATWEVSVSADAPEPGEIVIELSASGDMPLVADVRVCGEEWRAERCPGGAEVVREDWTLPRDDTRVELAAIDADDVAHVRLDIGPSGVRGEGQTQVRVHATGSGEELVVGPPPGDLPQTGMPPFLPWMLGFGVVLVGVGVVAARQRMGTASTAPTDGSEREGGP